MRVHTYIHMHAQIYTYRHTPICTTHQLLIHLLPPRLLLLLLLVLLVAFRPLQVIKQARSVVLLGGTLQPFNYIKSFLFPHVGMGPTSSSQSNPTGASQISQSTLTGASQISQSTLMGASQISRPASSSQQLRLFSCGHVVDKANIAPMVVSDYYSVMRTPHFYILYIR